MSSQHFIPPLNYGMIEEDLYRSGQPNELNFPFLEKLGLKTVVWLAPEEPNQRFINFIDDQEIHFYHLGVISSTTNAWDPITEEVVLEALELILNSHNYPMIIMCNLGRHRTGTIVGCLRKLQRWNLTSIFEEYRRYAGPKVRVLNEQFIELFDTDLKTDGLKHFVEGISENTSFGIDDGGLLNQMYFCSVKPNGGSNSGYFKKLILDFFQIIWVASDFDHNKLRKYLHAVDKLYKSYVLESNIVQSDLHAINSRKTVNNSHIVTQVILISIMKKKTIKKKDPLNVNEWS
ncbi:8876_t:CDS:2 [Entrophospora sp. SA101]|nr:8867_t:CDS:2 [Entrophospora sp. SA101]CAJ0882250.1 8876_t:CDS:2 [Entrophospora sp. SA101]